MPFHLSFEKRIPKPPLSFEDSTRLLNSSELVIIKDQIRKNTQVIDDFVSRLHLLVNVEKYPANEPVVDNLRKRMFLLMEENDTFRKVLWQHYQAEETVRCLR